MNIPFLYRELNLPSPPEHLISQLSPENSPLLRAYPIQSVQRPEGKIMNSVENNLYHVQKELEQWVEKNICTGFNDIGLKYNFYDPERNFLAPHTDVTRRYVLIFNLNSGDGDLVFWKEKNCEILRQEFTRHTPDSYRELEEILRINTPEKKWYIMNAMAIHSVENLKSARAQLQVSLNLNPFN